MTLSKKRDKARKRIERALKVVQPTSNLNAVQPIGTSSEDAIVSNLPETNLVQPTPIEKPVKSSTSDKAVQPKQSSLEVKLLKAGLKVNPDGKLDLTKSTRSPVKDSTSSNLPIIPLYDRSIHVAGDVVMVRYNGKLVKATVPDAGGQAIPMAW